MQRKVWENFEWVQAVWENNLTDIGGETETQMIKRIGEVQYLQFLLKFVEHSLWIDI